MTEPRDALRKKVEDWFHVVRYGWPAAESVSDAQLIRWSEQFVKELSMRADTRDLLERWLTLELPADVFSVPGADYTLPVDTQAALASTPSAPPQLQAETHGDFPSPQLAAQRPDLVREYHAGSAPPSNAPPVQREGEELLTKCGHCGAYNGGADAVFREAYDVIDQRASEWSGSSLATVLRAFIPEPEPREPSVPEAEALEMVVNEHATALMSIGASQPSDHPWVRAARAILDAAKAQHAAPAQQEVGET